MRASWRKVGRCGIVTADATLARVNKRLPFCIGRLRRRWRSADMFVPVSIIAMNATVYSSQKDDDSQLWFLQGASGCTLKLASRAGKCTVDAGNVSTDMIKPTKFWLGQIVFWNGANTTIQSFLLWNITRNGTSLKSISNGGPQILQLCPGGHFGHRSDTKTPLQRRPPAAHVCSDCPQTFKLAIGLYQVVKVKCRMVHVHSINQTRHPF